MVPHPRRPPLRPVALHPRERVLDVLRLQRRARLGRGQEQAADGERLVRVVLRALLAPQPLRVCTEPVRGLALPEEGRGAGVVVRGVGVAEVRVLEGLLDLEAGDGERADHLEGEEADDVDGVVAGLEVESGGEVEELLEALRCVGVRLRGVQGEGVVGGTYLCDM